MGRVDFLPEDYVQAKRRTRANLLCFGLFVVVMLAIVWAFVVNQQQDARVAELADEVNERIAAESRKLHHMKELNRKKRAMLEKARVTEQLLQRVPRSLILAELTNAMPKQCSWLKWELKTTRQRKQTVRRRVTRLQARLMARQAAGQPQPKEVKLTIEGLSPTDLEVSSFMGAVKKCPLFENVALVSTEEHKRGEEILRRFKICLTLARDAREHVERLAADDKATRRILGTDDLPM
jgi:hypothetical protein